MMVSDIIRPAADALRAERSQLLADVNEMASDPDRQDELVAVMRDVRRIDRRLSELSEGERQRELEAIVRDLAAATWPSQREALYDRARAWVLDHPVSGDPQQVPASEVVHRCPTDDSGITPCCGRTPFELPRSDRLSFNGGGVTCGVENHDA